MLLDEIEKAHPDVFNLLLQVMDEGRLTDSLGRKIDFKNTIIIMTSNIGTRQLKDFGSGVGFATREVDKEYSHGVLQKALNRAFSPEFLNRIDDIVMFDQLSREAIFKIIDIELAGFYSRMSELGYKLNISEAAKTSSPSVATMRSMERAHSSGPSRNIWRMSLPRCCSTRMSSEPREPQSMLTSIRKRRK